MTQSFAPLLPGMQSFLIHLTAFFQVVVVNCVQPANWEHCAPVHEWLLPELAVGYQLWTGQTTPYDSEKEFLHEISH